MAPMTGARRAANAANRVRKRSVGGVATIEHAEAFGGRSRLIQPAVDGDQVGDGKIAGGLFEA